MLKRYKFLRHWPAEMCIYWLLDSAKPGHIELSDQLAARKTNDGYQGKGCHHVEFRLDKFCVQMIVAVTFIVCSG